jgi:hypothetical protein
MIKAIVVTNLDCPSNCKEPGNWKKFQRVAFPGMPTKGDIFMMCGYRLKVLELRWEEHKEMSMDNMPTCGIPHTPMDLIVEINK